MTETEALYRSKLCSADEAVRRVRSGDRVYVGTCSSIAFQLCSALERRESELQNVTVDLAQCRRPARFFEADAAGHFTFCSYFLGPEERRAVAEGRGSFTSVHLSQIEQWCRETARPNVAFLEVSPCDAEGYMSFGASGVALHRCISDIADTVILQVNRFAPYVYGEDNLIHCSQAACIVEADDPLVTLQELEADDTVLAVSRTIVDLVPDGATIQLGLGGLSNAVGSGLRVRSDLGIHSELMSDPMMRLMRQGVVTNRKKTLLPGKSVVGFAFGSPELYRFLDHNPDLYFLPYARINDPAVIAQNDHMISINTAMAVDLFGQVAADALGYRQQSGVGGQLDFVRGAQLSREGKSIIAVTSTLTDRRGRRMSRIVSALPPGTAVTTPRSDVQYVATEYGCVNLKPLTMRDRVRALISLAHPDFREELGDQARRAGIL
jgi:4-hydroxybutyrate CoA-transferase